MEEEEGLFNSRKKGNGKPTTTDEKPSAGPLSTTPAASAASASKYL